MVIMHVDYSKHRRLNKNVTSLTHSDFGLKEIPNTTSGPTQILVWKKISETICVAREHKGMVMWGAVTAIHLCNLTRINGLDERVL